MATDAVDVAALTEPLANRLAAVVPDPSEVSAFMGTVVVYHTGIDVARSLSHDDEQTEQLIVALGRSALEITADTISEITADPWPAKSGQFSGGFPPLNSEITGDKLWLSYGDPADPLLTLEPIVLADVLIRQD